MVAKDVDLFLLSQTSIGNSCPEGSSSVNGSSQFPPLGKKTRDAERQPAWITSIRSAHISGDPQILVRADGIRVSLGTDEGLYLMNARSCECEFLEKGDTNCLSNLGNRRCS